MKDKFKDRLIIPITDPKGGVVGFTGRVFPSDTNPHRPKYLNSPESDLFKKGELLFGYDLAITSIRKQKWLIMVEGNMDVIAAHKFGITNIVASQGTSVTPKQITLLKRSGCNHVVIAFDNDNAGKLSGKKLFVMLINNGFEVSKLVIPKEYKDIDEYLPIFTSQNTQESYELHDFNTIDYLQYELQELSQELLSNQPQRVRAAVSYFLETLSQCPHIFRDQYIPKLSEITGIGVNTLLSMMGGIQTTPVVQIEEEKEHIQAASTTQNTLITSLQLVISLYYKKRLKPELSEKVRHMYLLAHTIYPQSFVHEDIDMYIQNHIDELDLINDEKLGTITPISIVQLFNAIIIQFESHISTILFDEKMKNSYQIIKQRV